VEPCQPGCHRGKREPSRFETTLRLHSFETAQAVARARWRRCSAFSLALRLLARIVALASSMRLQSGWDQAILPGTLIRRSPSPRRIIDGGARGSEGARSIVIVDRNLEGPS
jgi:hypothetical protein